MSRSTQHSADGPVTFDKRTDTIEVLYVEDDPAFMDLCVTCLENGGGKFSITTAPDAMAALELLSDDIDCIVSDYNMPEMDGLEFLAAVRERHPDIPFILFTAKRSDTVGSETFTASATEHLRKGGGTETFNTLTTCIRKAAENYDSSQ